jgi:hypothetical protein
VIRDGIRRIDIPARLGGDEFVVLLPETDPSGAFVVAETIRQGVREIEATAPEGRVRISVSIGLVTFPDDGVSRDELLTAADTAMYASKRKGKDRIGTLGEPPAGGEPLATAATVRSGPGRPAGDEPGSPRPDAPGSPRPDPPGSSPPG